LHRLWAKSACWRHDHPFGERIDYPQLSSPSAFPPSSSSVISY
jgi:hypothetical protein